ncbi:hypothetical protein Trydic_g11561 [Trypoxylus dichotomus]
MSLLKSINLILRASRLQSINQIKFEGFRGLYSATSLGLDGFIQQQERVRNQLANIQDKFKAKMKENVQEDSKNIVFTEDLKNMIHIASNEDVDIVVKMMKKFNKQNKELRFGNFIFGSVAMRMFYVLNKPNEALECFKSPDLEGFFDQLISYQLLCDLLYENQKYSEILDCFNFIKNKQVEGSKYPRNIVVIAFAACYRMNTEESLNYAMNLWKELMDVDHIPARRAVTFFAGLLLKHDKADVSLEVLSNVQNQNYTTIRNLKVLTLTKLNRLDDTIPILKSILQVESVQVQTFNKDVLDILQEQLAKQNNTELLNYSLEQQLLSEINTRTWKPNKTQNRFQSNRTFKSRPNLQRNERVALRDME